MRFLFCQNTLCMFFLRGCRGCDCMVVAFITTYATMQSVPITTNIVSSNPVHSEVYSIQHYVIKFVSDLRQVGRVFHDITEIMTTMAP
jgi:hypothetical protein